MAKASSTRPSATPLPCLLETLVHLPTSVLPNNRHIATFDIPSDTSFEEFPSEDYPGWDGTDDPAVARAYGSGWFQERRSAVLLAPSAIVPTDRNVVINPNHPDAKGIAPLSPILPFQWDDRLRRLFDVVASALLFP